MTVEHDTGSAYTTDPMAAAVTAAVVAIAAAVPKPP
jgi:hypothetical protein